MFRNLYTDSKRIISLSENIRLDNKRYYLKIYYSKLSNPLILWPDMGLINVNKKQKSQFSDLAEHFILVFWSPKKNVCWNKNDSIKEFKKSIKNITVYLINRFSKNKVILIAHSLTTIPALQAAKDLPELFYLYIAVSQKVNEVKNQQLLSDFLLSEFQQIGNKRVVKNLKKMTLSNSFTNYDRLLKYYQKWIKQSNYSQILKEQVLRLNNRYRSSRFLKGFFEQMMQFNSIEKVASIDVPVCFMSGRNDYLSHPDTIRWYFDSLVAADKTLVWFERSYHYAFLEESHKFKQSLLEIAVKYKNDSHH